MKGWRHIKEVALYQGGGAISRKWRYIKEMESYEWVAPYQGSGAISRRWRHIREVTLYPGGGVISRRWHPVQTQLGQPYRLQFLLPLPHLAPPDSSSAPLQTIPWTLSTTSAVLKPTDGLRHSGLDTRWVEAVDNLWLTKRQYVIYVSCCSHYSLIQQIIYFYKNWMVHNLTHKIPHRSASWSN